MAACSSAAGGGPSSTKSYSPEWQTVVDGALKEGSVNVSSLSVPAVNDELAAAFMEEYPGIQATITRGTTSKTAAAQIDEQRAQGALSYDAAVVNLPVWLQGLQNKGLIADIAGPSSQAWKPTDYSGGAASVEGKMMLIGYNTNLVKEPPTDWSNLLNPDYKGKVGVFLNQGGGAATTFYKLLDSYSPNYLKNLATQNPKQYNSDVTMAQALASGEIAIGNFVFLGTVAPLMAQGAPIKWALAKSGSVVFSNKAFAFKDAPHPNAAKLMIDFMMSERGQEIINGNGRGISFAYKVTGAPDIDLSKLTPVNPADEDKAESDKWVARFRETFGG
jgi:iron(III) transport system substrate-binding protein